MKLFTALLALLLACPLLFGCQESPSTPLPISTPENAPQEGAVSKTLGNHGNVYISEVTIDGETYIVANMADFGHGGAVAICPKVKPEAAK